MSPGGEIVLDLRDLPPPRPLEVALDVLSRLPPGGVLHLVLVHEPAPLFALLPDRGFAWRSRVKAPGEAHVACFHADDAEAGRLAAELLP